MVMSLSLAEDKQKKNILGSNGQRYHRGRIIDSHAQSQKISRLEPTVVPDLWMTVEVGANSMPNKIRTHLEATGLRYLTVSDNRN